MVGRCKLPPGLPPGAREDLTQSLAPPRRWFRWTVKTQSSPLQAFCTTGYRVSSPACTLGTTRAWWPRETGAIHKCLRVGCSQESPPSAQGSPGFQGNPEGEGCCGGFSQSFHTLEFCWQAQEARRDNSESHHSPAFVGHTRAFPWWVEGTVIQMEESRWDPHAEPAIPVGDSGCIPDHKHT